MTDAPDFPTLRRVDYRLLIVLIAASVIVIALGAIATMLMRGPRSRLDYGILWYFVRGWVRYRHKLTVVGREHLPESDADHDGLIVIANHTGSIDPFLIQSATRTWIRWMMGRDMMSPKLGFIWRLMAIIPVDRLAGDRTALREAMRHVKAGGAIGIFPEGGIARPRETINPFLPGVGMIAVKTGRPVVIAWVSGTPNTFNLTYSLFGRSRSKVVFSEPLHFERSDKAADVTEKLKSRLREMSGWPESAGETSDQPAEDSPDSSSVAKSNAELVS